MIMNIHLKYLYSLLELVSKMDRECTYWFLAKLVNRINFVRTNLGMERLRFKKGTYEIINK